MMTEERVRQYKAKLSNTLKDIHTNRMAASNSDSFDLLELYDRKFQETVIMLKTVKHILDH